MQNRSNPADEPGSESVDKSPQDKGENTPAGNTPPVWPGTQYFRMQRAQQISDSDCGPATIQMLLSNIGLYVTQPDLAIEARIQGLMEMQGMGVEALETAGRGTDPDGEFESAE